MVQNFHKYDNVIKKTSGKSFWGRLCGFDQMTISAVIMMKNDFWTAIPKDM